ncbi:MAG: DUF998 domain-containing protein [Anaerolineae bacterium]
MDTSSLAWTLADRILLYSGIAASVFWVLADRLAGALWKGYSFITQSISELSAPTAPTRLPALALTLVYDALMIVFGAGLWRLAWQRRLLLVMAGFIIACAVLQALMTLVVPLQIGEVSPSANTVNTLIGAASMLCFLLAIIFGAMAFHNWFRWFSIGILATYIILTAAGLLLGRAASGGPRAGAGIQERTMVAGYLVWVVTLAVVVLRAGPQEFVELFG